MSTEKKYCLYDGKLLKGRSDKEFCNDNCRNAFFNALKKQEQKEIRDVDLAVKKNRRILKTFLGDYKTKTVTKEQMLLKGFQFKFHTHFFLTTNKDNYCFCYNYGYLLKTDGRYLIVKEIAHLNEDLP